jgi:hypothetical protein
MNRKLPLLHFPGFFPVASIILSLFLLCSNVYGAFVPSAPKGTFPKTASVYNPEHPYNILAGLSNNEIEVLTGKRLTLREKAGLYFLRRKAGKGVSGNLQKPAGSEDKCFTMYLKNGDVLEVKLIQITPDEIKYKRCNKPDDPEIVIAKADVFSIKDSNGDAIYSSKNESWKNGYEVADGATDKLALASGITGIAALTFGLLFWPAGLAAGIAAGIMGIMSMKRFNTNRKLRGEGWAIVGITAGGLWVFFGILVLIAYAAGW